MKKTTQKKLEKLISNFIKLEKLTNKQKLIIAAILIEQADSIINAIENINAIEKV